MFNVLGHQAPVTPWCRFPEAFQDGYLGQTQLNLQYPSGLPPQEWLKVRAWGVLGSGHWRTSIWSCPLITV